MELVLFAQSVAGEGVLHFVRAPRWAPIDVTDFPQAGCWTGPEGPSVQNHRWLLVDWRIEDAGVVDGA